MDKNMMDNPVLVETALLGRGLPSVDNNLIEYLWPNNEVLLPYVQKGLIKWTELNEFARVRNHNDWARLDANHIDRTESSIVNGYLTASALIKLASPSDIIVTAGMGGVTEGRISQDLVAIVDKPVFFISSGFKDLIEAKSSLDYLRSEGIKVLGWKKPIYDGFLFAAEPHILDGAVDENNIKDVRFESGKGILIFNPVPEELKLKNKELLELARNKMIAAAEKGEDFHPAVNKLLDVETEGRSSLIQLLALMANLNLALQISARLGGRNSGFNKLAGK